MFMRFIRPEDRRRSGGDGSGASTNWADTEPVCFRSEAFAEDLPEGSVGEPSSLPRPSPQPVGPVPRSRRATTPFPGRGLFAALGWRLSAGD